MTNADKQQDLQTWINTKCDEIKQKVKFVNELHFSDAEIKEHLTEILNMVKNDHECLISNDEECSMGGYHEVFYRDEDGILNKTFVLCPKQKIINKKIQKEALYLWKDFLVSNEQVRLKKDYIWNISEDRNRLIKELVDQVRANQFHGFYLYGDMGVGKTYLMTCFVNELVENGHSVAFASLPRLLRKIKEGFNLNNNYEINEYIHQIEEALKQADCLVIDDMGYEEFSQYFHMNVLLDVFLYRYDLQKPTYFISNRSLTNLESYYCLKNNKIKRDEAAVKKFIDVMKSLTNARTYVIHGKSLRY